LKLDTFVASNADAFVAMKMDAAISASSRSWFSPAVLRGP